MVRRGVLLLFGLVVCPLALGVTPATAQQTDDCRLTVIIEDGDVYDGRGSDPVVTDVGILGDRIAAWGTRPRPAALVFGAGRAVWPPTSATPTPAQTM